MISEIHTHEDPILTREEAIRSSNVPEFSVKNIKETVSAFIF